MHGQPNNVATPYLLFTSAAQRLRLLSLHCCCTDRGLHRFMKRSGAALRCVKGMLLAPFYPLLRLLPLRLMNRWSPRSVKRRLAALSGCR